jgi:acetylornithine/N-succinyldiaminopimelate aminotransferase
VKIELSGELEASTADRLSKIRKLFVRNVVPSYSRFDLALDRGEGSYVWDVSGRRYLDLGSGNGVSCLGHAHPEISDALLDQSRKLLHVSNLYYSKPQGQLAAALVRLIGPGRCFVCNSGAEANEGFFKLAQKFGQVDGRSEIITANGSSRVPFNDLDAMRSAVSAKTAAILIEAIQGENGIIPATADYLLGLRRLCDEKNILLLLDEVQCGHFRTGRFQSWQQIVEQASSLFESGHTQDACATFLPDAVSMANSLGGGLPIGAFWVRERYANLLSPETHPSTFGESPLGCAVALKILEIIERDQLADHARRLGDFIKAELQRLIRKFPSVLKEVRGIGLMIGLEFQPDAPGLSRSEKAAARQVAQRLHAAGVLTIPAADSVIRILPPLNLAQAEAIEGLRAIEAVTAGLET